MAKAFSLIKKNENILLLGSDKLIKLYLEEIASKEKIFYCNNVGKNFISVIILDSLKDIEKINLDKLNLSNNILVFIKKSNIALPSLLNIKYLQDDLGYIKHLFNDNFSKFRVISFKRYKSKILYISDREDDRVKKINNFLEEYCLTKKYLYKKCIDSKYENAINRLILSKKQLKDTEYLLVIYKYSLIIDWSFNLEKFVRVNNLSNYALAIDKNPDFMFDNYIIKNRSESFSIIDEVLSSIRLNNIDNYLVKPNKLLFVNQISEIFNIEKKYNSDKVLFEYIINLNNYKNRSYDIDLDVILNFYLNIHNIKCSINLQNIYLKEYSWGIINRGVIGAIKFKFRNKLDYLNGEGTYSKITEHNYELNFGEYNLNITFYDNYRKFLGYDKNTKVEVIGFLHI